MGVLKELLKIINRCGYKKKAYLLLHYMLAREHHELTLEAHD